METPRTKVAGEGAQSGKPPAPEVGGAVNDDQPGDPPAGGTSSKKNSIKTRHRKPPFLKLPSRRVVPGKTPCTTYHESNKQEVEIIRAKQKQEQKEEQKERMYRQRHLKLTLSKQKKVQKQKEKEHKNQQQDQPDLQQDQSVHQTTREPDSFHIIRFRHFGKFVEFLRRNSTGYIVAFRVLENLAEAEHAYWCACRNEYKALKSELSFFTFRKINFSSAYRMVDQVKLGKDTIEKMLDAIFECYPDPEHFDHSSMELYLHTWFVLLGEGPRFEAIRIALFWMLTNYSHEDCPELGLILNNLVHSWSNVCRTAYYLRLMLLEEELALRLIIERPHKTEANKLNSCLNDIFAQFDEHWLMSQERCICLETSRKHIQDKIHLRKEEVGEKFSYGRIAYEQIVREYIPLLVFMERECLPIMMRRDGGYEKIIFPDIVSQEDETDQTGDSASQKLLMDEECNAESDSAFWVQFKAFEDKREDGAFANVLCASRHLLKRYFFNEVDCSLYEEILKYCNLYTESKSKGETKAAKRAFRAFGGDCEAVKPKVQKILTFLSKHRPNHLVYQGRSFEEALRKKKLKDAEEKERKEEALKKLRGEEAKEKPEAERSLEEEKKLRRTTS